MQVRVKSIKLKIISNKKKSRSLYISYGLILAFILLMLLPWNNVKDNPRFEPYFMIIFLFAFFMFYILRSMPGFKTLGYITLKTEQIHFSTKNKTIDLKQINRIELYGVDSIYTDSNGLHYGGNKNILKVHYNKNQILCERVLLESEKHLNYLLQMLESYKSAGINFQHFPYDRSAMKVRTENHQNQ